MFLKIRKRVITTNVSEELHKLAIEHMKKRGIERGFWSEALSCGIQMKCGGQTMLHEQLFEAIRQKENWMKQCELWKNKYMEEFKANHPETAQKNAT